MTIIQDLQNAGIPVVPELSNEALGQYSFLYCTNEQIATINYILMTPEQKIIFDKQKSSKTTAISIPNWATWAQSEWQTYFDNNLSDSEVDLVTSLATARIMLKRQNLVIKNLTKLVLAMRDYIGIVD